MSMSRFPPERIICLTEETVETLYLLGQQEKIVGVSGYAVRPPEVRAQKPRVSAFTSADIPKILKLDPDLVLTFSDLQADIVGELIRNGVTTMAYNQRDISGILAMIRHLGAVVGAAKEADRLASNYEARLVKISAYAGKHRPKVYFEEWNDPYITAIKWVSELIEIAGGKDIFKNISSNKAAKNRIISDKQIIKANPDLIIGSWCGKKVNFKEIISRPNWSNITAVKNNNIFEIKSSKILQPGPAALTDGIEEMIKIFKKVRV